jgi:hypothetical protein
MKDLTEKEYDELDELLTETTPGVKENGTGFLSRCFRQSSAPLPPYPPRHGTVA